MRLGFALIAAVAMFGMTACEPPDEMGCKEAVFPFENVDFRPTDDMYGFGTWFTKDTDEVLGYGREDEGRIWTDRDCAAVDAL